ncbi:MAG: ABC transporter permease [Chloroflexota bacterium]
MSRPAGPLRVMGALTAMELRLTARRGENVLVTMVIPAGVLLFFATAGIVPGITGRPVDFLLPGSLALAVIASGLVNLGIATAYERSYGVLKRLGSSPLPRWGLVGAKVLAVLVLEAAQVALLLAVATLALGWSVPAGFSPGLLVLALLLGTLVFSGLGLLLAGTLRAEATLALANGLFLGLLMVGGIILPIDHLPEPLPAIAGVLPAAALSDLFRAALGGATAVGAPLVILVGWGIGAAGLAVRSFRWE